MTEPTTPTGRWLHEDLMFAAPEMWPMHIDRRIEEAMAEARQQERERLRARHDRAVHGVINTQQNVTIASCPGCFIFDPDPEGTP